MPSGYPSSRLTRAELVAYALGGGIRERVKTLEYEISRLQRQFPEALIDTPIVLLKPEARAGGSAWPLQKAAPDPVASAKQRAAWTPARRKKQAKHAKKNLARLQAGRKAAYAAKKAAATEGKPAKKKGTTTWERMRDVLLGSPEHRSTSKEIQAQGKLTSVNVAQAFTEHKDLFKRVGKGVYTLTSKAASNGAEA